MGFMLAWTKRSQIGQRAFRMPKQSKLDKGTVFKPLLLDGWPTIKDLTQHLIGIHHSLDGWRRLDLKDVPKELMSAWPFIIVTRRTKGGFIRVMPKGHNACTVVDKHEWNTNPIRTSPTHEFISGYDQDLGLFIYCCLADVIEIRYTVSFVPQFLCFFLFFCLFECLILWVMFFFSFVSIEFHKETRNCGKLGLIDKRSYTWLGIPC